MSWVGRIWRRVAGSRNRCMVACGRQGREKPDSMKEREETRIGDILGGERRIGESDHPRLWNVSRHRAKSYDRPFPFPFLPSHFFLLFFSKSLPDVPPFDVASACHCVRSFVSAGTAGSCMKNFTVRRCFHRFRAVVTFNFYAATYRALYRRDS